MQSEICQSGLASGRSLVVVCRGTKAWLGQVHERMEREILETVSIKTSSKIICQEGGREMQT